MEKIISFYKKNKEVINYLIIGGSTTLISLGTYFILTVTVLDPKVAIELQAANIIAWTVGVIFAYITNRIVVFESKNKNVVKEAGKFCLSRISTLLIEMFFMFIFVTILRFNDKIVKVFVQIVVIVLNYVFSKLFVFKKKKIS